MGIVEEHDYYMEMDDPYTLLAHNIVATYRPADVLRCLTDNSYLKNLIIKEVRSQDLMGPFTDCIIENILEEKDRMEWMHALDNVAYYLYSRLNKERLRDEILAVLNDAGISLG